MCLRDHTDVAKPCPRRRTTAHYPQHQWYERAKLWHFGETAKLFGENYRFQLCCMTIRGVLDRATASSACRGTDISTPRHGHQLATARTSTGRGEYRNSPRQASKLAAASNVTCRGAEGPMADIIAPAGAGAIARRPPCAAIFFGQSGISALHEADKASAVAPLWPKRARGTPFAPPLGERGPKRNASTQRRQAAKEQD